jgi:hypothetical protein
MGGALTCLGRSEYRVWVGKGEGRRKLVRPRHRREGNVKKIQLTLSQFYYT